MRRVCSLSVKRITKGPCEQKDHLNHSYSNGIPDRKELQEIQGKTWEIDDMKSIGQNHEMVYPKL